MSDYYSYLCERAEELAIKESLKKKRSMKKSKSRSKKKSEKDSNLERLKKSGITYVKCCENCGNFEKSYTKDLTLVCFHNKIKIFYPAECVCKKWKPRQYLEEEINSLKQNPKFLNI